MVNKSLSFSKEHISQSEGSMTWWKEEAIGCLPGRFPPWCLPRPNIFPPPVSSVFHVLILFLIHALILSAAPKGSKDLTLSLPKCLMEFCKVTLTLILSLWMKFYDVTIQLKALCLYFHIMLFVCQNFRKWNLAIWSKFPFGDIWHWKG